MNSALLHLDEQHLVAQMQYSSARQLLRVAVTTCRAVLNCWLSSFDPFIHRGLAAWLAQHCVQVRTRSRQKEFWHHIRLLVNYNL